MEWTNDAYEYSLPLESDERLSYNLRALYDYGKSSYLPYRLDNQLPLDGGILYLYLEEWSVVGVNDYPDGHPTLDSDYVSSVIDASNVVYVGGPVENNIILFSRPSVST